VCVDRRRTSFRLIADVQGDSDRRGDGGKGRDGEQKLHLTDGRVRESLIVVLPRFAHRYRLGGRIVGPALHHRHPLM
jgi:hypothetical protein